MAREALYKKKPKQTPQGIDIAKLDIGDVRILKGHFGLSSQDIRALSEKDFDDYMNRFEHEHGDTDYMYRIISGNKND